MILRTRPGMFEGVGAIGLKWLQKVKEHTGLLTAVEVANSSHVKLQNGIHGQVKVIVHKTRGNTTNLVIDVQKMYGAMNTFETTSDDAPRSIKLCYHNDSGWMTIGGEISGTAEMVIA